MPSLTRLAGMTLAAASLCVGLPGLAAAQEYGGYTGNGRYVRGALVRALPTPFSQGGSCVPACPTDVTPCDPDYFKVADRRCNVNQSGFFPRF